MLKAPQALLRCALLSMFALALAAPAASCGGATTKQTTPKELTPREIMERFKPAIVRIENNMGMRVGTGTGFLLTPTGRIATNLHVIVGGGVLRVKLSDDTVHAVRRVVAIDQDRDLAVIEIDVERPMSTVKLGDSDAVVPGDSVTAVGNPMRFDYTVSDGLISSVRQIEDDVTVLQISAPISQGSSGGPLFNAFGEVIGVATFVSSEGQNINFGMPINYIRPLLEHDGSETVGEFAKRFKPKKAPGVIKTAAGAIERNVPKHDVSMLSDCSREQVMKVYTGIQRTIELGAPLYNDGDHLACFNIYQQTAMHFEKDPKLCKGLRDSFGAGLLRSETERDATRKAWAMRDTFDGLLAVIVELARRSQ
ncbi:MAG: serine protease [Myxococcales bacterium]|nr:serine protease [Myxococcales bacterium]